MLIPFLTFYGRGRCFITCPVLCVSISLAPDRPNAFQSTIDCWIWWVHESPGGQSTACWCFCGDQNRLQPQKFRFWLAVWHHSTSHREENTLNGLVGTRKCLRKLKCTIVAILRRSYSICLDVKCSNSSNHRRLVSVPVPCIRDISLLCYRFQSEWITETAKRSNV